MFVKFLLLSLLGVTVCSALLSKSVPDWIKQYGYPVETYTVETSDGYILDLFRIPHGVQKYRQDSRSSESDSSQSSQESSESRQRDDKPKVPVLLMSTLLSTPEDFVIAGSKHALAFYLADMDFDVYLGSVRGSVYGRKHTHLNPDRDAAFWRFCSDDMGKKDLPAIVDKVLEISAQPKLIYYGHMLGNTIFFVMTSELPEYNDKIYGMIASGPQAFMGHTQNQLIHHIHDHKSSEGWISRYLGPNEFKPATEVITEGGQKHCKSLGMDDEICNNVYFLLHGYNSKNLNHTTIQYALQHLSVGASTRQLIHYTQWMESGRFTKFNADLAVIKKTSDEYDLSNVVTPVAFFYTPKDSLSTTEDVEMLMSKLPKVVRKVKFDQLTNNVDLLYSNNVGTTVYPEMMTVMKDMLRSRR